MVWPPIYSVSLTFAGCPLQLYLLRMFCSSAHRYASFRTWFFKMFFNKGLIKCEKFVSCLTQHSKKYWKWPETYKLILHCYWTPQFQNFTNLPIGIFGVSNPLLFFFCFLLLFCFVLRFLRNYVSIIVNIISNNTVLMCYLLWIFVSIRRLLQHWGLNPSPLNTGCYCFFSFRGN